MMPPLYGQPHDLRFKTNNTTHANVERSARREEDERVNTPGRDRRPIGPISWA